MIELNQYLKIASLTAFSFIFSPAYAVSVPKVIAYVPSWKETVIPYEKLTHINYAFALPQADGHLKPLEDAAKLNTIVSNAQGAGVKVSISVGGWSYQDANGQTLKLDPIFEGIGADPARRANLVSDIVTMVNQYDLDGVDLDWEFPDQGTSADNFNLLITELHNELNPNGKLLTAAVGIESAGDGITSAIQDKVDWVNIMSYNHTNLNSAQHATFENALSSVADYQAKGFSNDQLVLGVPFYGRDEQGNQTSYADLITLGADPEQDIFNNIGYNGILTMQEKARFIIENDLAGVMFWELSQDANGSDSLLTVLHGELTSVPIPQAYIMMMSGLGLIGFMTRRRNKMAA